MSIHDISVFDADNHLYETRDAFTKFLPERYKGAIDYVDVHGRTKIVVRGQISDYIPNPTFDVVARPGAQEDYYRHGNPEGKSAREIFGKPVRSIDAWREPAARLKLMDEQGLARTLMFPTLASLLEERMRDDVDLVHAVVHSLNEWLYETWQFNYADRIFTTPVITLPIVDKAIEELEWVLERGAKVVLIRPAPVPGLRGPRSFGLPEFDPFWARVQEADILVALHSSDSGYARYSSDWMGRNREMLPFQPNTFQMLQAWRPVEDAVSALVCHGALSRFPRLKVAIVENGMSWVAPLLTAMKNLYKKMPQDFLENPVDVVRRNIYISPFWEEDLGTLAELLGEDHVLFGSDYPHPEGLASPLSYVDELAHLPEPLVRKMMGENLARLMNLPASR
ncbi:Predicted metal-dependent hydrolase, TIM-barrel fold [Parafrankia irregularis]|uniref:Predicted metal-dependent hydrolase, TIM-barrel fold n=1 Tax=Parafrankia irregularis TaxID=795642 RepID=A0A0S4QHY4_9ACTN|nr:MULTISPECIES: amidohydrolase family protein [Parafrankia]MBE3200912.1 amidohydrolase [Parafrankia sp. CH37]CUU54690.1 Predicted metal-dependent hydrolase, TIM-barrel fold [Parafrankia irregularis]